MVDHKKVVVGMKGTRDPFSAEAFAHTLREALICMEMYVELFDLSPPRPLSDSSIQ